MCVWGGQIQLEGQISLSYCHPSCCTRTNMQVNYLRNNLVVRPFMLYYCFTTDLLLPYYCLTNMQVNCLKQESCYAANRGGKKYVCKKEA